MPFLPKIPTVTGRRWVFGAAAAVNLAFYPVDLATSHPGRPEWLLAARILLAAWLLLGVRAEGRPGEQLYRALSTVVVAGAMIGFVALTGGVDSYLLGFAVLLPAVLGVVDPDDHEVTRGVAMGVLGVGLALIILTSGKSGSHLLQVAPLYASVLLLVGVARHQWHEVKARALASEQARRRALEALARSERRRERSERLALIGQIAAGVTHEVSNPLAYVRANVAFLAGEAEADRLDPRDPEVREVLADLAAGVERIATIVADMRRFAREDAGEADTEIGSALREAVRLASVRLRDVAEVELALPADLPRVRIPHGHLVQVVLNLLVNAADALASADDEAGGPGHVRVAATSSGGRVSLTVRDDGPGLPEGQDGRIFDPFFTTKPPGQGTGLGLALCQEYVGRAGGELRAGNHPEGGAVFTLDLEAAAPPAEVEAARAPRPVGAGGERGLRVRAPSVPGY